MFGSEASSIYPVVLEVSARNFLLHGPLKNTDFLESQHYEELLGFLVLFHFKL